MGTPATTAAATIRARPAQAATSPRSQPAASEARMSAPDTAGTARVAWVQRSRRPIATASEGRRPRLVAGLGDLADEVVDGQGGVVAHLDLGGGEAHLHVCHARHGGEPLLDLRHARGAGESLGAEDGLLVGLAHAGPFPADAVRPRDPA